MAKATIGIEGAIFLLFLMLTPLLAGVGVIINQQQETNQAIIQELERDLKLIEHTIDWVDDDSVESDMRRRYRIKSIQLEELKSINNGDKGRRSSFKGRG